MTIVLQDILGSGVFGEVWKAVVQGINGLSGDTVVAVKKLKCEQWLKSSKCKRSSKKYFLQN